MQNVETARIGIIGLGYVGLPLATAFGAQFPVVGFDIDRTRIAQLRQGEDRTRETTPDELATAQQLTFSYDAADLAACTVYIVTVPTPVDAQNRPDLSALVAASQLVATVITPGDVVIYESTVYPGATEEDCVPVIEAGSQLKLNVDFFAGYSPERINPGDRAHRLADIVKVTSGSTPEAAEFVDALYARIVTAGTHRAPSIRVAEAAKVIENTQRDVNIALINELAVIFSAMDLDTLDVLEAAGTKWNFLPFRPGLVGGHCIGVDPYYLTHKAQALGYDPQIVLAGRRLNDRMGAWMAQKLIRRMIATDLAIKGARVLVLGLAFKENVPDLRNTRVIDIVHELQDFGMTVDVHDPLVDAEDAQAALGLALVEPAPGAYDAVVFAVPHDAFGPNALTWITSLCRADGLILDVKGALPKAANVQRI